MNVAFKLLDKLFRAGFKTDKQILQITLEDLIVINDLTNTDSKMIVGLKKAIKEKKIIEFLSSYDEKNKEDKEHDTFKKNTTNKD